MKKTIKLAFAAFAFVAFTACGNQEGASTATEAETETMPTDASMGDDVGVDLESDTDTTTVQDTTVNDGVVDEMQ
ncbi:hypothetical protein ACFSKU_09760 [Pontibacter silvestris]|uniref:Entericidin n=1 Tax=Pontibacter silvestris TaxID=2305183 RepID=A0ABW4WZ78_9BACT|nr:hypothetical protein [Pontibacter silvestris]MCC9136876.1 hypothetical protein [Pontibacter silvestris]